MSATSALVRLVSKVEVDPVDVGRAMDVATHKEWRDWLPETVREFCGLGEDDVQQLDKLMAVQVVLTNEDVGDEWPLFQACVSAFNHRRSSFMWLDKPSYLELAWAGRCIHRLKPNLIAGPHVLAYIAAVKRNDGVDTFPYDDFTLGDPIIPSGTYDELDPVWVQYKAWENALEYIKRLEAL